MHEQSPPRTRRAVWTLMILATLCGEMLSGSMPPLEFIINPLGVVFLMMLYGSGAVLIREFVRRWDKGWPSILMLGIAYGIYEEGLVVRSFFDPTWQDLDILAEYGRWIGVNWIWSINLTWFHAVVSIAIPIALTELMYPSLKNELWVARRGLKIHGTLFGLMLPIGVAFEMVAPPLAYAGCALLIVWLVWRARRWPDRTPKTAQYTVARQRSIGWLGFLGMVGLLFTLWILPAGNVPPLLDWLAACAWPLIVWRRAVRLGARNWGPRQRWVCASDALLLWIILALLGAAGPDMPLAGLLFLTILWRVGRHVRRYDVPPPTAAQIAPPAPVLT
ncbi:MAG: hypothetical protein K8S97_02870 [Anaerolineae bacterium]|nr:hypothetical protein [Anaerolineae bacterium]